MFVPNGIVSVARRFPAWVLTALVSAAIIYLTLFPHPLGDSRIELFEGADKFIHAVMFGALYGAVVIDLWLRRLHRARPMKPFVSKRTACLVAVIAIVAGGAIEVLQYAMGLGRGMELGDWLADTAGVVVCMFLSLRISPTLFRGCP